MGALASKALSSAGTNRRKNGRNPSLKTPNCSTFATSCPTPVYALRQPHALRNLQHAVWCALCVLLTNQHLLHNVLMSSDLTAKTFQTKVLVVSLARLRNRLDGEAGGNLMSRVKWQMQTKISAAPSPPPPHHPPGFLLFRLLCQTSAVPLRGPGFWTPLSPDCLSILQHSEPAIYCPDEMCNGTKMQREHRRGGHPTEWGVWITGGMGASAHGFFFAEIHHHVRHVCHVIGRKMSNKHPAPLVA